MEIFTSQAAREADNNLRLARIGLRFASREIGVPEAVGVAADQFRGALREAYLLERPSASIRRLQDGQDCTIKTILV